MSPNSGEPSPTRRVIAIVGWSLIVALLFSAVGLLSQRKDQDLSDRIVRFATTGLLFGAVFGAIHARAIKGWLSGAAAGMICGAVSGTVWWIATFVVGMERPERALTLLGLSLLANAAGGAVVGILFALLMVDRD